MIRLDNITKTFGRRVAVRDLTLQVKAGEFFAFLGPNGAGKTTTIKMIAGLLRPAAGRVSVCGYDMAKDPLSAKRLMSYVPDQPYLYDKLTGLEFMHFMGNMYGIPRIDQMREIDRLTELFGMREFAQDLTESYSHGMKQRLVLAATLLHHPKVIVVDEPMVGLDPHSSRQVKEIFQSEAKGGAAIFMSTHVLSIAEDCAERIGIILNGRLLAIGTMDELRGQAQTDGRLEEIFFKITEAAGADRRAAGGA